MILFLVPLHLYVICKNFFCWRAEKNKAHPPRQGLGKDWPLLGWHPIWRSSIRVQYKSNDRWQNLLKENFLMQILHTYKHWIIDTVCVGSQCNSTGHLKMPSMGEEVLILQKQTLSPGNLDYPGHAEQKKDSSHFKNICRKIPYLRPFPVRAFSVFFTWVYLGVILTSTCVF